MFDVPELRLEVFRYLWITEVRPLKLVCKTWYPEADQAIWESIATLPPLLRFLPEDAWENITRPLRPEDWSEVMRRARHVKSYRMCQMLSSCTDAALEAIVACPPPGIPLLAGVRLVTLDPPSSQLPLYAKLLPFLIPHQYITTLDCTALEQFIPDADSFIPRFQRLRSLKLHVDTGKYAHENSLLVTPWHYFAFDRRRDASKRYDIRFVKALERCPELRHLDLAFYAQATISMLRTLSENPILRSLTLRYGCQDVQKFEDDLSAAYSFPAFPSLRHLEIRGLPPRDASRLLTSRTPTPLEGIRIIDNQYDTRYDDDERFGPAKDALLNTLGLICSQLEPYHSLRVLDIQSPSYNRFSLSLEDLRPLSAFPDMREITFLTKHDTMLVDADCEQMADWWPRLEVFAFGYGCPEGDPKCTLRGLLALASGCPYLARLELPLDARSILADIQPDPNRAPPPYNSLAHLDVGDAPITDTEAVAQFLKTTFPKLRYLDYSFYREHGDLDRRMREWNRVVEVVTGVKPEDYSIHDSDAESVDDSIECL
ncbi:hypothetical protein BD626DRAFT_520863 [Schizophyllum amplum]|uniref:F-box domain-containing protein n=1 Tax=Schizophyllum amplum TaxID=97359 RepID=A0A550BU93_9AGAR|nr:hypothetical protein BD626DRAFT_520863 [Auriculariopsis ampla]